MNRFSMSIVLAIVAVFFNTVAFAQGSITGSARPCQDSTERYSYCRTSNFPYHWRWSITSDASVKNLGTSQNCYLAEVTVGKNATVLTFHQSNPPGVPQVHNVTKQISPKKCESVSAIEIHETPSEPVAEIKINWAEYKLDGQQPAHGLLHELHSKHQQMLQDKALVLDPSMESASCSYVYWGCGSCSGGGARVDAYCGSGGSGPDYSWCESC